MEELTTRQAEILSAVTERYIATGRPVGSKDLCRMGDFDISPSTMRGELASLEALGFLGHPHTSAGRVPTDRGYRFFVDNAAGDAAGRYPVRSPVPGELEGEIGYAIQEAAELLAGATGLLAMVSSPEQGDKAIKHIEVLQLQPDLVTVVVITAAGGVTRKLFVFDEALDPGLVKWAHSYLNDAACGLDQGSRLLRIRLNEAELSPGERAFVEAISPALLEADDTAGRRLVMEGAPRLLSRLEEDGDFSARELIEMLDRQDVLLRMLRSALAEYRVYLRIGSEFPTTAMRGCSLVAANYGLAHRNMGTVGVLGPTRMDYPVVIGNVEQTARCLSRFIEEIY